MKYCKIFSDGLYAKNGNMSLFYPNHKTPKETITYFYRLFGEGIRHKAYTTDEVRGVLQLITDDLETIPVSFELYERAIECDNLEFGC